MPSAYDMQLEFGLVMVDLDSLIPNLYALCRVIEFGLLMVDKLITQPCM